MSAAMDVAYLDAPYIAHVPRKAVLLRMSPPCWEDSCHDCQFGTRCICACHDDPPLRTVRRCRKCRYLVDSIGHLVACEPDALDKRVQDMADSIGMAA